MKNAIHELQINNRDARIMAQSDELHHLRATNAELLAAVQCAYTILADVRHQWSGRHSAEGQAALVVMRDSIAKATGREAQDVQDEFSNGLEWDKARAAIAKAEASK